MTRPHSRMHQPQDSKSALLHAAEAAMALASGGTPHLCSRGPGRTLS